MFGGLYLVHVTEEDGWRRRGAGAAGERQPTKGLSCLAGGVGGLRSNVGITEGRVPV